MWTEDESANKKIQKYPDMCGWGLDINMMFDIKHQWQIRMGRGGVLRGREGGGCSPSPLLVGPAIFFMGAGVWVSFKCFVRTLITGNTMTGE